MTDTAADRQAIREALHRLARGTDRNDEALVRAVYMPDARLELESGYQGSFEGFLEWTRAIGDGRRQHNIPTVNVGVAGDRASSEAYVIALLMVEGSGGPMVIQSHSRYLDDWVRTGDGWRIALRRQLREFQIVHPQTSPEAPDFSSGRRDTSDPSYVLDPPL